MKLQTATAISSKYKKYAEQTMKEFNERAKKKYKKPSFWERMKRKYRTWMYDFKRKKRMK